MAMVMTVGHSSPPPPPPESQTSVVVSTFRRFKVRHVLFKMAFVGLFLSALLFIIGISCPAWKNKEGLWMSCQYGVCNYNFGSNDPAWINAVRALELLALKAYLICLLLALYQDVFKSTPSPDNKAVEITAALAGILSLAGVAIYGAENARRAKGYYKYSYDGSYYYWVQKNKYLNWAYGLTTAGSILVNICAILIAYSRIKHAALTTAAMNAAGFYIIPGRVVFVPPGSTSPIPPTHAAFSSADSRVGVYPTLPEPYNNPYPYIVPFAAPTLPPSAGAAIIPTSSAHPMMMSPQVATAPPQSDISAGSEACASSTPNSPVRMPQSQAPCFSWPSSPVKQPGTDQTSSVPVCYVINSGQTIPVYNELPSTSCGSVQ